MSKKGSVPRPIKKSEYRLVFNDNKAEKAWNDLIATQRNAMADTWDALTKSPEAEIPNRQYSLKGEYATRAINGVIYEQRQFKPTVKGTARIWYCYLVAERVVVLTEVFTAHPNGTK